MSNSRSLPTLDFARILKFSQFDSCNVVLHWGLNFYFIGDSHGWESHLNLFGHLALLSSEDLVNLLFQFSIGCLLFYLMIHWNTLCILDSTALSEIHLAKILQVCGLPLYFFSDIFWWTKVLTFFLKKKNLLIILEREQANGWWEEVEGENLKQASHWA